MNLAPICLFTYNRLKETKETVTALQNNYLAKDSELFVFSDGSKNIESDYKVKEVRDYLATIKGFKKIVIFESKNNKGLAKSIINGVTKVLENSPRVIVVEDDLVTTPNFLNFMNQALDFYANDNRILTVSGYTLSLPSLRKHSSDYYFGYRASSWGWGVWKDRWCLVDWDVQGYDSFIKDKKLVKKIKRGGSDMPKMLQNQMKGKIDSWAIRLCYYQFCNDLLTVFPKISKVQSIGFSDDATHTSGSERFFTTIDTELKENFIFKEYHQIDYDIQKDFLNKTSKLVRIKDRINKWFK